MKKLLSITLFATLCCTPCLAPTWQNTAKIAGFSGTITAALALAYWRLWPTFSEPYPQVGNLDSDRWENQQEQALWRNEVVRLFGYDTHTNELPPASDANHHTVVIFSHALPDDYSEPTIQRMLGMNYHNVAHLNFKYRTCSPFALANAHQWRFLNFGGTKEAMVLAYHLRLAIAKGYTTIILWGHSRGGAAILTLLDMLDRCDAYAAAWKTIGCVDQNGNIDRTLISQMKQAIKHQILAKPLLNRKAVYRSKVAHLFSGPTGQAISGRLIQTILVLTADHSILDEEPSDILARLAQENKLPPTHLTVGQVDPNVTTDYNHDMERALALNNHNIFVCEPTGHMFTQTSIGHLSAALERFAKQQNQ